MLAKRIKDPDDLLKLVIVRDTWLTGFDAPNLHTMYVDKPKRGQKRGCYMLMCTSSDLI